MNFFAPIILQINRVSPIINCPGDTVLIQYTSYLSKNTISQNSSIKWKSNFLNRAAGIELVCKSKIHHLKLKNYVDGVQVRTLTFNTKGQKHNKGELVWILNNISEMLLYCKDIQLHLRFKPKIYDHLSQQYWSYSNCWDQVLMLKPLNTFIDVGWKRLKNTLLSSGGALTLSSITRWWVISEHFDQLKPLNAILLISDNILAQELWVIPTTLYLTSEHLDLLIES